MQEYAWIGWLISAAGLLIGIFLNRYYKKVDKLNKAIDNYVELVLKIEDMALDYWISNDEDIYPWQITLQIRRLSRAATAIKAIDSSLQPPSKDYIAFKQAVDLIPEDRPINHNSTYAVKIMTLSAALQDFYKKP